MAVAATEFRVRWPGWRSRSGKKDDRDNYLVHAAIDEATDDIHLLRREGLQILRAIGGQIDEIADGEHVLSGIIAE